MRIYTSKQIDRILGACITVEKLLEDMRNMGFPKVITRSNTAKISIELNAIREVVLEGEDIKVKLHES